MRRSTLVGVAACLLASAQDEPLIPVRVVFSNPHAVSLHLYWFDPETPEVGSFLMTLAPSEERPVDTFIGEEYGVALDGAEELGARFSVRGALEPTHSAAIDDEVLCEFGAWPAGVPLSFLAKLVQIAQVRNLVGFLRTWRVPRVAQPTIRSLASGCLEAASPFHLS